MNIRKIPILMVAILISATATADITEPDEPVDCFFAFNAEPTLCKN